MWLHLIGPEPVGLTANYNTNITNLRKYEYDKLTDISRSSGFSFTTYGLWCR